MDYVWNIHDSSTGQVPLDCIEDIFSLLYFHLNSAKFERKTENILGVTECLSYIFRQKATTFGLIINMKMIQDSAGFMFEAEK